MPVLVVMVCLPLLLAPSSARAEIDNSGSEDLASALVAHGFENVLVSDEAREVVRVFYENRVYRYELRAMGVVLALVSEKLTAPWTAEMIPLRAGVPIVSVVVRADEYGRYVTGDIDEGDFARSLVISTNPPTPDLSGRKNSSFGRFDISVGPSFTVELEQIGDQMRGQFNIVPQVEADIAKGVFTTAQLVVPVVDELEEETSGVRPGRATIDWLHRHGSAVGLFRTGLLYPERYGFSLEAGRWVWEDRLLLTAKGDFTGKLALLEGVWEYSDIGVLTYSIGAQYMYPFLDVAAAASFGRFLGEEMGGRFDLRRALGELEIGFFVIKTESESLGGILVDVPLPLNRYSRPSGLRFKTVPSLTWEYRSKVTGVGRMPGGGQTVERLYKELAPTFIRNNVSEWVDARRFIS